MQAPASLTSEQRSVLRTTFHFLEMSINYLRSILPVVGEVDERLVKSLVELAESCLRNLPMFFPELRGLEQDQKNRGGR